MGLRYKQSVPGLESRLRRRRQPNLVGVRRPDREQADTHPDADANPHAHTNSNADTHPDADTNPHAYTNSNTDPYSHTWL